MSRIDVFNGDADGLCAIHQLRMAYPAEATLISGVKRDIQLLKRVNVSVGDTVTVCDISFDSNRADALRLLSEGAMLRWFDHHYSGEIPEHPGLEPIIDSSPEVCSSLLVDMTLGGKYRAWAVAGAFGDNLHATARRAATVLGLSHDRLESLAELGELLNYNGYGDSVADLHFAPAELYLSMAGYSDPWDFMADCQAFSYLRRGYNDDMMAAEALRPCLEKHHVAAWILPDLPWARRVIGVFANRLAVNAPDRAHALLVPNGAGNVTVSVRAPKNRPTGADDLCRCFASGGGRKGAAGVNQLPMDEIGLFLHKFSLHFAGTNGLLEGA